MTPNVFTRLLGLRSRLLQQGHYLRWNGQILWLPSRACFLPVSSELNVFILQKCHAIRRLKTIERQGKLCTYQQPTLNITVCDWDDTIEIKIKDLFFPKPYALLTQLLPLFRCLCLLPPNQDNWRNSAKIRTRNDLGANYIRYYKHS